MTTLELLSQLDSVRSRGTGKWSARCPAHSPDKNPSLTVSEGKKGILLRCFAGCDLNAITRKLGIAIRDLFYDGLPEPRQRLETLERRAEEQIARRTADKARGRKADLLKQAEYLVQSARGMTIDAWSPAQLDKRLNILADAYDVLWEERHEQP